MTHGEVIEDPPGLKHHAVLPVHLQPTPIPPSARQGLCQRRNTPSHVAMPPGACLSVACPYCPPQIPQMPSLVRQPDRGESGVTSQSHTLTVAQKARASVQHPRGIDSSASAIPSTAGSKTTDSQRSNHAEIMIKRNSASRSK